MTATQINFDQAQAAAQDKPEPSPWDEAVTNVPSHSEATVSANTRIEMPTDAEGKHFAIWQFTFRSGYTYDDLAAAIDAITFIHGSVAEAGGNMHDIVVGGVTLTPEAGQGTTHAQPRSNGAAAPQAGKWGGPGGWDADVNSAFMMATEVSLDFSDKGDPFVRVYDGGYFSKYGLSVYPDAKKGPSPIEFYGLEQVVSQGRPKVRFPLSAPLKVYYWHKEEDGKIKPMKGVVPFSLMEPDETPPDDRPVIHAGR